MKKIIVIMAIAAAGAIGFASCSTGTAQKQAALEAQLESLKMEMAKKQIIDSMNTVFAAQAATAQQVAAQAKPKVIYKTRKVYARAPKTEAVQTNQSVAASNNAVNEYAGYSAPAPVTQPVAAAQQKKGWSAKAKGAAIGGGAGALAGALIGNQKGKGAVIGGLIGAAAGLGTGAIIDKRKGR
jgi:hypothetical protein